MPTPDTETLAARLRTVERALTDEDATLDPPNDDVAAEELDPDTAAAPSGASGPDPDVSDRLCRLEAAVQALHAALDERDSDTHLDPDPPGTETAESSGTDTHPVDEPPGPGMGSGTGSRRSPRERGHDSRAPSTTGWPDDLGAE